MVGIHGTSAIFSFFYLTLTQQYTAAEHIENVHGVLQPTTTCHKCIGTWWQRREGGQGVQRYAQNLIFWFLFTDYIGQCWAHQGQSPPMFSSAPALPSPPLIFGMSPLLHIAPNSKSTTTRACFWYLACPSTLPFTLYYPDTKNMILGCPSLFPSPSTTQTQRT